MEEGQLLEIGFVNTSYKEEDETFTEFTLIKDGFRIDISGLNLVEINFGSTEWITVTNCKKIDDLKNLIRLFS